MFRVFLNAHHMPGVYAALDVWVFMSNSDLSQTKTLEEWQPQSLYLWYILTQHLLELDTEVAMLGVFCPGWAATFIIIVCDTNNRAKLHWLQPSGYLAQPLATQWLTQRLIAVLKASYLTHKNNKRRYHTASFSWLVSMLLKNASYLAPTLINSCFVFQPWPAERIQLCYDWRSNPCAAWEEVRNHEIPSIHCSFLKKKVHLPRKPVFLLLRGRLTAENKALRSMSLNLALSPDYTCISVPILLPLLLLLVNKVW